MKTIYLQYGLIKYAVSERIMDVKSNYNKAIHIRMVGEHFPQWGTVIKETDNTREYAKKVINSWAKR